MTEELPDEPLEDSVNFDRIGDDAPADAEPGPIDDQVLLPDDDAAEDEPDSGPDPDEPISVAPGSPHRIVDGVRADARPVRPELDDVKSDRAAEWDGVLRRRAAGNEP